MTASDVNIRIGLTVAFGGLLSIWAGCSTTRPPTLENDRERIAVLLGVAPADLHYVARGEIAATETFQDYFTPADTAILGLTHDSLLWTRIGESNSKVERINLADIDLVANDLDAIQVTIDEQTYLVRVRSWQRHQLDRPLSAELTAHLVLHGALRADPERYYQKPISGGNRRGTLAADRKSSPSEVLADMNYEPPDPFAHKYPQDAMGRPIRP